jgi:sec-independent protein translocase protein TatA
MFSNLKGWEWLIIVALILLLFGAKRLPDAARGLGRSLRIFKAETKGLTGNDSESDSDSDSDAKTVGSKDSEIKAVAANDAEFIKSAESSETKSASPTER